MGWIDGRVIMKSYTVTQRVYAYDTFEEDEIPEGMTPAEYAEQRYCHEIGDLDSHTLLVYEDNEIIYDGEALGAMDSVEDNKPIDMNGRCGAVGMWADDDGDEVKATCIVKVNEHINNLHASADLFWTNYYVVPTCDECSDLLTDPEDVVNCPDGKIRCATCVEAMYRENGGN